MLLSSLKAVGGLCNPFPYVQLLGSGIKLSAFFSCSRTIPAHKSLMNSSCIQVFSQNNNRSVNSLKCVHDQFACNQPIWTDWVVVKTKIQINFSPFTNLVHTLHRPKSFEAMRKVSSSLRHYSSMQNSSIWTWWVLVTTRSFEFYSLTPSFWLSLLIDHERKGIIGKKKTFLTCCTARRLKACWPSVSMAAVTNTAFAIWLGNFSMANEMHTPPISCPTKITWTQERSLLH